MSRGKGGGRPPVDMTGKRYGTLTAIAPVGPNGPSKHYRWRVRCDCGAEFEAEGRSLRQGLTLTCGRTECRRARQATDPVIPAARALGVSARVLRQCVSAGLMALPAVT